MTFLFFLIVFIKAKEKTNQVVEQFNLARMTITHQRHQDRTRSVPADFIIINIQLLLLVNTHALWFRQFDWNSSTIKLISCSNYQNNQGRKGGILILKGKIMYFFEALKRILCFFSFLMFFLVLCSELKSRIFLR